MTTSRLRTFGLILAFTMLAGSVARAADAPANILTYKGQDRDRLIADGARKEGLVVIYSTMIVNQALRPLADAFMKKYPFVKATYWRGDIPELFAKIAAEAKSDNRIADVIEGSLGEIAVGANITQPYYSPASEDMPDVYRDPKGEWLTTRMNYFGLAYNTKQVSAADVPKSYEDLLDPKWKGKLSWRIDECCGHILFITSLRKLWGEDKAMAYFKKLTQQNIVNFAAGSARTLVDRVMAGEYPLAVNIFAHHPLISAGKGASVATQLFDPAPSSAAQIMVLKNVTHPAASLLFVDFTLSEEGQKILAAAEYFPARKGVAALPSIAGAVPANVGVKENFISPLEVAAMKARSSEIYNEIFR